MKEAQMVLVPGQPIRRISEAKEPLNGTYRDEHGDMYASLLCREDQIGSIQVANAEGGKVIGVVTRVIPRKGVEVRLLDRSGRGYRNDVEGVTGLIRPTDIGCWNMNSNADPNVTYASSSAGGSSEKHSTGLSNEHLESQMFYWMNDCYRPGDIVRCSIVSVATQILLSSNSQDLGCITSPCNSCKLGLAYPISYNAVLCKKCGATMLKKTAKPVLDSEDGELMD
ncbi:exosomal 3'-5' exoribonuclease-like protein [Cryptosporidium canis]|uniref:Exosomal 3'-5' exoribonuclease-like protein n=1 Tax=Cryptosporidium canis TaxID=195482 RepID=A0A9D5DMQ5_9CRYT|nr:exosomal 3'-5' exoribonuclease-like protein [Cryptosporidium canis]